MKVYIRIKPVKEEAQIADLTLDYAADLKPGDRVVLMTGAKPNEFQTLYIIPPGTGGPGKPQH